MIPHTIPDGRIRLATVKDETGYSAGDPILDTFAANGAVMTKTGDSAFFVQGCFVTGGGVLSYSRDGGTTKCEMNSGTPLGSGQAFGFPMEAIEGETYDFFYSADSDITEFIVTEVTAK